MADPQKQDDKQAPDSNVGSSDNIAGYKVKEFSDYLGEDLKQKTSYKSSENSKVNPIRDQPVTPKKESLLNAKMFIVIAVLIFLGVLVIAYINHKNSITNLSTNPGQAKNPAGIDSSSTTTKNPLTDNGSIDSQLQYCTNPVNAENNC